MRRARRFIVVMLGALLVGGGLPPGEEAAAQQLVVPRVEQMPNLPQPYAMRNWKAVARAYDAFVFDQAKTGEYLPVVWQRASGPNYPAVGAIGLHTYVGTYSPANAEAINVLPALVGATLVGIDKRAGTDYVAMAQQYFNRRPEENVYLNGPVARSGGDWWYDTMPNVFFYQLYALYGRDVGDFAYQFRSVADRWLEAVEALGASTTPWTVPYMKYRGIALATMEPNRDGVPEPEAAGAIAWLLYHAYVETGDVRYRIGAEQAMEFLMSRTINPSYELQLPYGAYAAARMNAELGTDYDVEQLVNWTFDVGPLRNWGALVGTWGGYDVHGLIGEDDVHRDYAFMMNGFQQAAALVPLVRYDDRFARAIGKWVLNLANASRLFYPGFLPPDHRDDAAWSATNDPHGVVAQEAMREHWLGTAPFATGDAKDGRWARTNLSLYSSSSVGYLAALVDTTNVPGILRLDLRATDFFGADAYPTYLYYNPHTTAQAVTLILPDGTHDLYDATRNETLAAGASGSAAVEVPSDAAVVVVVAPAGGVVSSEGRKRLVDGVVVDYAAQPVGNAPPRIKALAADRSEVSRDEPTTVYCTAADADGDALAYTWTSTSGTVTGEGAVVAWTSNEPGEARVGCSVSDGEAASADTLVINVVANGLPVITGVTADPPEVDLGQPTALRCAATDPDDDPLVVQWTVAGGAIEGEGAEVAWTLPDAPGYYTATCTAVDGQAGAARDSVGVAAGHLVLHLPFSGSAEDASGFGNHAGVHGATLTTDHRGRPGQAYAFDGGEDHLLVPMHPSLGFAGGVTVSTWLRVDEAVQREAFAVSHGSWQHRWKLSLTPDQRLRWTLKTDEGTYDLDDPGTVAPGAYTFVVATFEGAVMRLYRDGRLLAERTTAGTLASTGLDLTLGQMVPGDARYNLSGALDDVRVYNRALDGAEAQALYARAVANEPAASLPAGLALHEPFPNPFSGRVSVPFTLAHPATARLTVYDIMGREVVRLLHHDVPAGAFTVDWDGRDGAGLRVASGMYLIGLTVDGATRHRAVLLYH